VIPFWGCIFLGFFWGGATCSSFFVVQWCNDACHPGGEYDKGDLISDCGWGRDTNLITKRCKSTKTTGWSSLNKRWLCATNCRAGKTFPSFPWFPTKMTCFFRDLLNSQKKISFPPKWHILCLKDFWATTPMIFKKCPLPDHSVCFFPLPPGHRTRLLLTDWGGVNLRRVCEELGYS